MYPASRSSPPSASATSAISTWTGSAELLLSTRIPKSRTVAVIVWSAASLMVSFQYAAVPLKRFELTIRLRALNHSHMPWVLRPPLIWLARTPSREFAIAAKFATVVSFFAPYGDKISASTPDREPDSRTIRAAEAQAFSHLGSALLSESPCPSGPRSQREESQAWAGRRRSPRC